MGDPPATQVGGAADGTLVGPLGPSSAPVGQTVVESGADHPAAVAGVWVGALAAGCVGGAGGDPVAAWLDGQRALLTPPPARTRTAGKLFRPLSRACAGGLFALKPGSCSAASTSQCSTVLGATSKTRAVARIPKPSAKHASTRTISSTAPCLPWKIGP